MGRLRYHARHLPLALLGKHATRERVRREYTFALLRRFTPVAAVDCDGSRYLVWTTDRGVSRDTFLERGFDRAVMQRLIDLVEIHTGRTLAGTVFVDVGANIGTTTVEAVRRFGARLAVAFEPEPQNVALLRSNVALNGLVDRVVVEPIGLSDEPGPAELALSADNTGDHRIAIGENRAGRSTVAIRLERLDDALAQLRIEHDDIGLVWVDTQGHEASVLAGAPALLASGVPIVIEYWPFGLRRSGGLERLHELVAASFTTFVDARDPAATPRPTADLPSLVSTYVEEHEFTDLLLHHG